AVRDLHGVSKPMAFLSIERVSKYFPVLEGVSTRAGRQALFCVFKDVDLRIAQGEFVTLIGHSGCGKSTLLNIVAGFEQASIGGVILDGNEVTSPGPDRMVVFQSFALMPWLSAFDNGRLAVRAAHPTWDKTRTAAETQKYLDMWSATQHTVFMVTHDVDETIVLSDRIALMTNSPAARLAASFAVNPPRPPP